MYIFAVALLDGSWHHVRSYAPEKANNPQTIKLWHKIRTIEDPKWTEMYHDPDANKKRFGGRVEIIFNNGDKLVDELGVANAHPAGAKPFKRADYVRKFDMLTEELISKDERNRFISLVERLPELTAAEVQLLNVQMPIDKLLNNKRDNKGIF
jgi:2-methylcitrate dehydratase